MLKNSQRPYDSFFKNMFHSNQMATKKKYTFNITVSYLPFPSEEKRREAYFVHTKMFLKAKERLLKESGQKKPNKQ